MKIKKAKMYKRKPKRIIESGEKGQEQLYAKFPGKEFIDISKNPEFASVGDDYKKLNKLYQENERVRYTELHTHQYGAFPSKSDIFIFLNRNEIKTSIIAERDSYTGEVKGYFIMKKTKKTKPIKKSKFLHRIYGKRNDSPPKYLKEKRKKKEIKIFKRESKESLEKMEEGRHHADQELMEEGLSEIAKKYNFKYKFIPVKGYVLEDGSFERKEEKIKRERIFYKRDLEAKVASIISISLLIVSIIFLSSNLTGLAIANLTQETLNITGVILFMLGLMGLVYYFKRRKK